LASVALAVALASAGLWWHEARLRQDLVEQLAQLKSQSASAVVAPAAASSDTPAAEEQDAAATAAKPADRTGPASVEDHKTVVIPVPYGEDALSGSRLETLRQMMRRLAYRRVQGVVEVRTYPGRFCLIGNATEGFSVAPEDTPFSKCNAVSNPHEDSLQPAQRESLGFANLANEYRVETGGVLTIQLLPGDAANTAVAYPQGTSSLLAGEWNTAAAANNRLEVRLR
jgi:hypothetical protein